MRSARMLLIASATVAASGLLAGAPASAQSVMQQCGQQYQAAKAANTLDGKTWTQFRTECAARLKAQPASQAQPASAEPAPPATAAAPTPAPANPLKPAPAATAAAPAPAPGPSASGASAAAKPISGGRAAFLVREKQCGAEWRANKSTLVAQTPGLRWPKFLSQCNARLKAAGQ